MAGKNYGPIVSGYLDPTGRNWEDVIFQKGKAVLDKELNLGQDIDVGQAEAVIRRDLPSGWISDEFLDNASGSSALFVSSPGTDTLILQNPLKAHVNGWIFTIQHTGTINTNTVTLGTPPTGVATNRIDLVFLEVWRILLSPAPSTAGKSALGRIFQQGNVKTDPANDASLNFTDDIFDATIATETTKRVQLQYRLRVQNGVNLFSFPYGLDDVSNVFANSVPVSPGAPDGTPTTFNYVNQNAAGDAGLWVAGDGNPANSLGTVDGFMYAIPLCAIFRRNSVAFNPFTNMNGAGKAAASPPSDRPDDLFNDQFVSDDIADLRLAVSPTGWNYQEVLDKNLTYLLDNSLRSEWSSSPPYSNLGTVGHTLFASNQVGISSANGGSPPFAGDATGGGPRVAQFDNVCRNFSGRAIYEVMTVAVPAPGGGWANNSVVTINPSTLAVYPYSTFNWAAFAPNLVEFADVIRAEWIGNSSGTKRYDAIAPAVAIAGVTNNGGLIEIQTAYANSLVTGASVVITGPYIGTVPIEGLWVVTVIDSTHFTLQGSTFAGSYTSGGTVNFSTNIINIQGLGVLPIGTLTLTCGPNIAPLGLTNETLYVDVLVAYPPQNGLAVTPTADFSVPANNPYGVQQQTFMVNNPTLLPNATPYYFDQTLLTPIGVTGFDFYNPTTGASPLALLDWTHREARLTYTTTAIPAVTFSADSETNNASFFLMPERVSAIVSVLRNGVAIVGSTAIDPSGRLITLTNSADYTHPGDTLTVSYKAIRPFPEAGEQVTMFFDVRAPQTSRLVGLSQQVIPKNISKQVYSLTTGVASPDAGYPFPTAYVQTGGVYAPAFAPGGLGEYELAGEAFISISDFNASTGMLALPVYLNYSPNPDQVTLLRALTDLDSEGRTFFKQTQANVYVPNAYAQDLSDQRRHKNFFAFVAELAATSPLGFTGQLVLVLLTRWADSDETNGVFFDTNLINNTTSASIFRLRNNMLNKRA